MKPLHQHLYVAGQITEADIVELAKYGIKTIINNRPDNEEPGQMNSEKAAEVASKHGVAYHYLPMVNGQPLPPSIVNDFKKVIDETDEPVLAHCRSGMRSSFIWALGAIPNGEVTVEQAIAAAQAAGIPLANAKAVLESVAP